MNPVFLSRDDEPNDANSRPLDNGILNQALGSNPFLDTPLSAAAIEYKKGYVMRKCCFDANYKKSKPTNSVAGTNESVVNIMFIKEHTLIRFDAPHVACSFIVEFLEKHRASMINSSRFLLFLCFSSVWETFMENVLLYPP